MYMYMCTTPPLSINLHECSMNVEVLLFGVNDNPCLCMNRALFLSLFC